MSNNGGMSRAYIEGAGQSSALNSKENFAPSPHRVSSIDRLRASGQMTAEDEAHHVRLMGAARDRAKPQARELFAPAAADAVKHYEEAARD